MHLLLCLCRTLTMILTCGWILKWPLLKNNVLYVNLQYFYKRSWTQLHLDPYLDPDIFEQRFPHDPDHHLCTSITFVWSLCDLSSACRRILTPRQISKTLVVIGTLLCQRQTSSNLASAFCKTLTPESTSSTLLQCLSNFNSASYKTLTSRCISKTLVWVICRTLICSLSLWKLISVYHHNLDRRDIETKQYLHIEQQQTQPSHLYHTHKQAHDYHTTIILVA